MKDAVKSEWQVRPLGEVVTLNYGKALARSERDPNGRIPVYGANGVMDWSEHTLAEGPSLVIGRKGSAGEVTRVDGPFWPSDVTYYTSHDHNALDFDFLHYTLLTLNLPSMARGVKPGINRNDVYALPIPLPPLEEQRRIVAVLDEAFEGLARARAHAEANLQNARELFENYREEYLDPTSRADWRSVQLDQLIDIKHGFAFKSAFFEGEGQYAVLTPGNYYETGGFKDRGEKQRYYSGEFPSEFILKKGDLLVAMTEQAPGLLGSCMIVPEDDRFLHNQRLGLITPKNGVSWSADYFAQAFNLKAFRKGLSDTCSGATVRHTSPKRILAESIPYCEDVAQLELAAAHLSEREEDCRLMEKSYRAKVKDLDDLRQSLLQKAFAGELT